MVQDNSSIHQAATNRQDITSNHVNHTPDPVSVPLQNGTTHQTSNGTKHPSEIPVSPSSSSKKRKFEDSPSAKQSKKPSPPWKKFEAEGPSSFTVGGQRVSARRNRLPLDLQPQGQTRGSYSRYREEAHQNGDRVQEQDPSTHPSPLQTRSMERASRASSGGMVTRGSQIGSPTLKKSTGPRTKNHSSLSSGIDVNKPQSDTPGRRPYTRRSSLMQTNGEYPRQSRNETKPPTKLPRLRLYYQQPSLPTINPLTIPRKKTHASLREFLDRDDPLEGDEERRLDPSEAQSEAAMRNRLVAEGRPGGKLSKDNWSAAEIEPSDEPPPKPTHQDYLLHHILDLGPRILREARDHRALAKRTALQAAEKFRQRQPRSSEEILEDWRKNYRFALISMLRQWDIPFEMVKQRKIQEYRAQEEAVGREQMLKLVQQSEGLLAGRVKRHSGQDILIDGLENESQLASSNLEASDDSKDDDDIEDEDDSSASASTDEDAKDSDDQLSDDALREKYANIPENAISDVDVTAEDGDDGSAQDYDQKVPNVEALLPEARDFAGYELEEVDEILIDKSDDESGDTTEYSSEEDHNNEDDSDEVENEEEEEENSLLALFSRPDREKIMKPDPHNTLEESLGPSQPQTEASSNVDVDTADVSPGKREEKSVEPQSGLLNLHSGAKPDEEEFYDAQDERKASSSQSPHGGAKEIDHEEAEHVDHTPERRTRIPSLLRGQLREYQHDGLDWLAGMYENDTNGILADEMGLGKTIQTIALLAHLAEEHHVWGPHLIVVPTSVMLNWEMEFKKWCPGFKILTYYGTFEERKAKRRGWMDNDRWHVCITSYQLALQDAPALKRRNWHYLVLDEAHNIKNFRSQRWQTLLSFKSQARLLLTGTPLQNNLTELWSLLFFLAPEDDESARFGDLAQFSRAFHRPVDQILENGREALDDTAREVVTKLHKVLRPHLLRRLKADVEKQMPKKYEHVTVCRLSKRQRQLYDSYMSLAGTRESFASGNYMSIINCLMQLRKVCNHPDLFETRQIVTSFAMPKSAIADYEVNELLVRRRLFGHGHDPSVSLLLNLWKPNISTGGAFRSRALSADKPLITVLESSDNHSDPPIGQNFSSLRSSLASLKQKAIEVARDGLHRQRRHTIACTLSRPTYSESLLRLLDCRLDRRWRSKALTLEDTRTEGYLSRSSLLHGMVINHVERSEMLKPIIQKFVCVTPPITAPDMTRLTLTKHGAEAIRFAQDNAQEDPYHEARVRQSIAFPDKTLIQYDCGKLQQLDRLLRRLQTHGHRALIFTQMTKVLNILEQFLNLHGHRYLRLDGATKIEERQVLTDRFNNDPRILAFILSSRSGGLGINLTGADTVIFYDLDWNPAMDKQCQDRCHRIGQTRDVHIYRFVSEGTIEANILRKSNQKRMLDDVVIQEGDFTTEYFNQLQSDDDADAEADAALDKVLGGGRSAGDRMGRVLGQAEDKEDQEAARTAQKEDVQLDVADFADKSGSGTAGTPRAEASTPSAVDKPLLPSTDAHATPLKPAAATTDALPDQDGGEERMTDPGIGIIAGLPQDRPLGLNSDGDVEREPGDLGSYMVRFLEHQLRDQVFMPPQDSKNKSKAKKAKKGDQGIRIRR